MLYTEYNNGTPVFCGKVRSRVTAGRTDHTGAGKDHMIVVEIDFTSDEAIYLQLRNQIVMGIATARISEGEALPSVRQMADLIGVNMHTVNKAYAVLRDEGYVRMRGRSGAYVADVSAQVSPLVAQERERRLAEDLHRLAMEWRAQGGTREEFMGLASRQASEVFDGMKEGAGR